MLDRVATRAFRSVSLLFLRVRRRIEGRARLARLAEPTGTAREIHLAAQATCETLAMLSHLRDAAMAVGFGQEEETSVTVPDPTPATVTARRVLQQIFHQLLQLMVGELLDLVLDGATPWDIRSCAVTRFDRRP